jgi:hypothetical protein
MATVLEPMDGMKFGCDPELFVLNKEGVPVCADGLIPGTKSEPYPVKYGAVQVDGMAAEFNIEPVTNFKDFKRNVKGVMRTLERMLPDGYSLSCVPHVMFSQEEWDKAPEHAKELGCSPDFNAWTGSVNPPPSAPNSPTLRTASGHLHIGWTDDVDISDSDHIGHCRDLVKQLDWYLGAPSVKFDPDPVRRQLYGKAGAMRVKPYGVEYRVLSNFWLKSDAMMAQVWNRTQRAIWDMREGYKPDLYHRWNDRIIAGIDSSYLDSFLSSKFHNPLSIISLKQPL